MVVHDSRDVVGIFKIDQILTFTSSVRLAVSMSFTVNFIVLLRLGGVIDVFDSLTNIVFTTD